MENRLEGQDIQGDELFMELTPEELQELEQLKGGFSPAELRVITYSVKNFILPPYSVGIPDPDPRILPSVEVVQQGVNQATI